MNYGRRFEYCTRDKDQDHAHGKEIQKSKMAVSGGLTNSGERREGKSKGEKERYTHLNADVRDVASIPGSERSSGERNGHSLHYSYLEWVAISFSNA